MTSLARKQTQHGATAARETSVATFLPYTRHVDNTTIATKDGYLFQVIDPPAQSWTRLNAVTRPFVSVRSPSR